MTAGAADTSMSLQARQFRVEADLEIDLDGVAAYLHGQGDHLVLYTSQPGLLWRRAREASLPELVDDVAGAQRLGQLGDALARAGLRLRVEGPHGVVVSLGQGLDSRLGRRATGSAAVRPGRVGAVALAVTQRWRGRTVLATIGSATVTLVVMVIVHRRASLSGTRGT